MFTVLVRRIWEPAWLRNIALYPMAHSVTLLHASYISTYNSEAVSVTKHKSVIKLFCHSNQVGVMVTLW